MIVGFDDSSSQTHSSSSSDLSTSDDDDEDKTEEVTNISSLGVMAGMKRSQSSVTKLSAAIANMPRPRTSLINVESRQRVLLPRSSQLPPVGQRESIMNQETDNLQLAVLVDRFMKNTPRSVEMGVSSSNRSAKDRETRMKIVIGREKQNALKRDFRYFNLVDCLSPKKL